MLKRHEISDEEWERFEWKKIVTQEGVSYIKTFRRDRIILDGVLVDARTHRPVHEDPKRNEE